MSPPLLFPGLVLWLARYVRGTVGLAGGSCGHVWPCARHRAWCLRAARGVHGSLEALSPSFTDLETWAAGRCVPCTGRLATAPLAPGLCLYVGLAGVWSGDGLDTTGHMHGAARPLFLSLPSASPPVR